MPPPPISIIGAGLSGLVLGRCLLHHGIRTVLFEKDSARAGLARYGYGITLQASAYVPLLKILDLDERAFRRKLAVDSAIGGIGRLQTGAQDEREFRANRQRLEQLLKEGLDIRWEHQLTGIESGGSSHTLAFSNSEQVQSAVVVDGEGPHSQIRKHVSPSTDFKISPFAVYNGKRRLSGKAFEAKFAAHMNDANVIERRNGQTLMQVSVNDRTEEEVSISYTYSRPARSGDPIFNPDRPNSGARDIPQALFDEVASLGDLEGPFQEIFDPEQMKQDRLLNWLMRSVSVNMDDLTALAGKGILLIGDAAHATPILGGYGANVAISDAVELANFIAKRGTEDLASFYGGRQAVWWEEIEESQKRLASMHAAARASL